METKEITISENTAALMQALKEMHEAYFNACAFVEEMKISNRTSEAWNELNKAFRQTIGNCVYSNFILSDYTEI